jgi:hypothetical protein
MIGAQSIVEGKIGAMQHRGFRATLSEAITCFLERTPPSQEQAHRFIREGKRALRYDTLNFLLWGGFFSALTDRDYFTSQDYLLECQQTLNGEARQFFQAYVSNDYTETFTPDDQQIFAFLEASLDWLSTLTAGHPEDDSRYQEIQHTVHSWYSRFPKPADEYDERIIHFLFRSIAALLENIEAPTMAFQCCGYLYAMPLTTIGNRDDTPSLAQDFAWAKNALAALQGKSWLAFQWQLTPTAILLIVR